MISPFWYARYYHFHLYFWFIITTLLLPLSCSIQTQRIKTESYIRSAPHPNHTNDPFGPPPQLQKLEIGQALSQPNPFSPQQQDNYPNNDFQVICLSKQPHLFLLRNFVPPSLCQHFMSTCSSNDFTTADTTEGNDAGDVRRGCQVAWKNNDVGSPAHFLGRAAGNLILSQEAKTCRGSGCEPLQVLRYAPGGEFILHHDGLCRITTVLYYLNGIAGTWFPFAGQQKHHIQRPRTRDEALQMVQENQWQPGYDGVLVVGKNSPMRNCPNTVVVEAGDAVVFYNYHLASDGKTERADWLSMHAGLPTSNEEGDEKLVANHWMHAPELFQNIQPTITRDE